MSYLLPAWGGRDAPLRSIRSSPENIAITSLDPLLRCQLRERLRRPWMSGVPGARSTPLAGKTSRRWVPSQRCDPACFLHSLYRRGTQNRIPWSLRSAAESHGEVLRLGVVEDDGGGRLLGVELVFFGEGDADLLGV